MHCGNQVCRANTERLERAIELRQKILVGVVIFAIALFLAIRENAVTVSVSTDDTPTISTGVFTGGKVSIFLDVEAVERFELPCDDVRASVRCGTEPIVMLPGDRTTWIYNGRQWHLIHYEKRGPSW